MTRPSELGHVSDKVRVRYGAGLRLKPEWTRVVESIAVSDGPVLHMV